MLAADFTDNEGAIHSAERILNILGLRLNYPKLSHMNNLRHSKCAVFSVEALELHQAGGKIYIEHVSPLRHLTQEAIAQLDKNATDEELTEFVRSHYQLVLLSPSETLRLNKHNRSKMHPDRLNQVNIQLVAPA